jgi:hypothetical protein
MIHSRNSFAQGMVPLRPTRLLLMMIFKALGQMALGLPETHHVWLMRCFPDLFCFGYANFGRGIRVLRTFMECGRALFRNKSHRFRQSLAFVDAFYRIVQDAQLVAAAAKDLRRPVMSSTISKWSRLSVPDIVRAAEDEAQGIEYSNIQFRRILHRAVQLLKMRQGNVFSPSRLKDMLWGRIIVWSLPSLLLCITISADNKHMLDIIMGPEAAREFSNTNSQSPLADNSKSDPFLLARMLSICARGMVDDLLGFKQLRGGYTGVFGNVRGYLASVTSKGQGKVAMNLVVC